MMMNNSNLTWGTYIRVSGHIRVVAVACYCHYVEYICNVL